jgi:CSLREA domain-containing protein
MPPLNSFTRTSLVLAISQAIATPSNAATITVDSLLDNTIEDAVCTLREAIITADDDTVNAADGCVNGSGADIIEFSGGGTVTLSSALPIIFNDLVISGPAGGLTVNADGNGRVLSFDGRVYGQGPTVSLSSLTLTGGYAVEGGGISAKRSNVSLSNCTVSSNTTSRNGGGIFATGGG